MITILAIIVGAAWRRWFGSHLYGERWMKVMAGIAALGLLLLAAGHDPLFAGIAAAAIIGWFTVEHGNWMDMGTMPVVDVGYLDRVLPRILPWQNGSTHYDAAAFTIHYTVPGLIALVLLGSLAAPVTGIVASAGYMGAMALRERLPTRHRWLDAWTAYGELILGGAVFGLVV
jgi:uncharacterized membrane protein YhhN